MNLPPAAGERLGEIARLAGRAIMDIYERGFEVAIKADDSPLTCADRASHAIIVRELAELAPEIPILSEEGEAIPYSERRNWERCWLVDPLDGTKEFIKRNGEFTVNIALIEAGRPVLGVVYVPARDLLYLGKAGEGAWRQAGNAPAEPIEVVGTAPLQGWRVVMSRSHPSQELATYLEGIDVAEVVAVGSSLKLCAVAEGRADLYPRLGPTMEWDTAAGQAVVEAAGGVVCTAAGERLHYNKENLLNPHFFVSRTATIPGLHP